LLDSTLSERDAEILRMRHGFNGYNQMTLLEIGNKVGLSRERIRQIEESAYKRLKTAFEEDVARRVG